MTRKMQMRNFSEDAHPPNHMPCGRRYWEQNEIILKVSSSAKSGDCTPQNKVSEWAEPPRDPGNGQRVT
jgi:hypothetical protein